MWLVSLLGIVIIAAGFIVLHFSLTHRTAELKIAGWVLVAGGALNTAALFYFPLPSPPPMEHEWHHQCMHGMGYDKADGTPMQCHKKMMPPAGAPKPKPEE